MDKIHAKPRIVFCHQGRPSKVFRLFNDWLKNNNLISSEFIYNIENKLARADDVLFEKKSIVEADKVLWNKK
jgi:hypothetical protein